MQSAATANSENRKIDARIHKSERAEQKMYTHCSQCELQTHTTICYAADAVNHHKSTQAQAQTATRLNVCVCVFVQQAQSNIHF